MRGGGLWVGFGALLKRLVPWWVLESPFIIAARHPWRALLAAAVALVLLVAAIGVSGLVPMRASTKHWAPTAWALHFVMRRSVVTHATLIEEPPLDDPSLVLRGAGHYDLTCRPCHGGPAGERPLVPQHMVPPPRALSEHVREWESRDLFYIVKHGMKFTGMPAWPAQQRDDEVWAMVAFLRRLPELTREEYVRLARGAEDEGGEPFDLVLDIEPPPEIVAETCARCHGVNGLGRGLGAFPALAGQRSDYLELALRAYAEGLRNSGIMAPIAAAMTPEDVEYAVRYYASLPPAAPGEPVDAATVARGRVIATEGVPELLVPACVECHGPALRPKYPAYPRLAGQYAEYLALQLQLLKEGRRGGSPYVRLMHAFADQLTEEQIEDVAAYFASLSPTEIEP